MHERTGRELHQTHIHAKNDKMTKNEQEDDL